ncbi:glutamine-synthetase adenylyltransferase [Paracoccus pacificus]|uniref:Glutamine-synthetase adenylyltransferase n=1 Tax=Paracoccus pacificus TaxID=1463598 RepID=A0ABW4RBN0_9RHOB
MSFADQISRLPVAIDRERGADAAALFPGAAPALRDLVNGAAGSSPYLAGLIAQESEWLPAGLENAANLVGVETDGLSRLDPDALGSALRRAKRRVALVTALADLGGVWTLEQVTGALTDLADRATDLALRVHLAEEYRRDKLPRVDADAGGLFALAMGKMGAGELNYSSDIDLIVLYDDALYDDPAEARAALIRITRKAAATLSDITAEGYVFRTDLRLRPDAAVTPVCLSMSAAEAYYEAEGRTWERAAYIKARPCAGDLKAGARFLTALRPFVWRRHLDFAAIQDAHDMRLRIRDHKGLNRRLDVPGHDMKLGEGGIREIEFFAQTRQLIAGGRDPALRVRGTVPALAALAAHDWLPADVAAELTDHYRAHREVEHRIQMVNDAQTHKLPTTEEGLATVAALMGETDVQGWADALKARLARVEELTGAFFAPSQPGTGPVRPQLSAVSEALIKGWRNYPALRSERARALFRRIEPELLTRMDRAAHTDEALRRFDAFLAGLPAGVQLFSLFEANPQLIDLIVDIFATAPGLSEYLSRHPGVLDAVLGGAFFSPWPGPEALRQSLSETLAARLMAPDGGYERALDEARKWDHEWHFRIGVHHLRGLVDAAEAAIQYADLADAVLGALFPMVADEFARRHGAPPGRGAVLLGMGSLGARQLNAESDLDLIMIYDAAGEESSDGSRPLAPRPYYARLTQAMVTALTALMPEGRLYEVDMRLRPSGRGGPVATSIQSFRDYQLTEAWTWEHLALTRARVVALCGTGGTELAAEVEAIRQEVLRTRGDDPRILPDLAEMRERIFAAKRIDGAWEAKVGPGRLQDIELLAQSFALRAGSGARGTRQQIAAGQRAGLIDRDKGEALAQALRLLWRLQAGTRLLTERPLDMEAIGPGGQAFLLRETGFDDLDGLAARLTEVTGRAAGIIDAELGTAATPV